METAIIKDPNTDSPLNSSSYSHFLTHNGFNSLELQLPDMEMTTATTVVTVQSLSYTSLRDLLPSSSSSPGVMSPTPSSSWYEIPIKNPLVKHAAMAYLQPMSSLPEIGSKGLFSKLRDKCFCRDGACGCFGWLSDVVLGTVREFWERTGSRKGEVEDDEDEDEDHEKDD